MLASSNCGLLHHQEDEAVVDIPNASPSHDMSIGCGKISGEEGVNNKSNTKNELLYIDGYTLLRLGRPNTNKYTRDGGICIYVKHNYEIELNNDVSRINENLTCL